MTFHAITRLVPALIAAALLAGCAAQPEDTVDRARAPQVSAQTMAMYAAIDDGEYIVPAVEEKWLSEAKARQEVDYWTDQPAGSIVVDPWTRHLYYILGNNRAMRYTVAVGKQGRGFSGSATIPVKKAWPSWTPTQNMIRREPELYGPVAGGLPGGLENPLGARALYLYRGGRDTFYRIHGTPYPWTIGHATSAGCIRLYNQDIMDLYERVESGARVTVLPRSRAGEGTYPPGTPIPEATLAMIAAAEAEESAPLPDTPGSDPTVTVN